MSIADHLSFNISLRLEDGSTPKFKRFPKEIPNPTPEECRGELTGFCFFYAFCGEQDFGIEPLRELFGATGDDMTITTTAPLREEIRRSVIALMAGDDITLTDKIAQAAQHAGLVGYWDEGNFIICASKDYAFIIGQLKELIQPGHARFGFSAAPFSGVNLLILKK